MSSGGAGHGAGRREPETVARGSLDGRVVSEFHRLALAPLFRFLDGLLEGLLWLVVVGSALAFGAVHPWAYRALWVLCGLAGLAALTREAAAALARRHFASQPVGPHSGGAGLVGGPRAGAAVPLLWPGLAFLGLVLVQLLPLSPEGTPLTLSAAATRRGLGFVAALLVLHMAAAVAFTQSGARRRFRRVVAWLGLLLGLVALVQLASGLQRIYGVFEPWEGGAFYGSFVNRNHFAGYMLLVIPLGLGLLAEDGRRYRRRLGDRPTLRRRLVAWGAPEGTQLLYSALPPLVAIAALLASLSRGGILAFVASLALAAIGLRSRRGTPAWAAALVFVAVALFWFGLERLEVRLVRAADDAPGRTVVWAESLTLMDGSRWLTGFGFNTFAEAFSRIPAWRLPEGATPWPEEVRSALESGARFGYRAPGDLPGLAWYREAHNDWLQLLVETGLAGLAIGAWAALAALLAARRDPWLLAALAGPLVHAFVDFDFQIPAIPVLFVVLAALAGRTGPRGPTARRRVTGRGSG
jgi:O-antigen ligase